MLRGACLILQLLAGVGVWSVSAQSSASQNNSDSSDSVVFGVLELLTSQALSSCEEHCEPGLAQAFNVNDSAVGCVCPTATASTRRRLFDPGAPRDADVRPYLRFRRLDEDDGERVAFSVRIPGGLDAGVQSLETFAESTNLVADAFGVGNEDLRYSVLAFTPPESGNLPLDPISSKADASDVDIVLASGKDDGVDYAGGGRGVALFFAMLVLVAMTFCCCFGSAAVVSWTSKRDVGDHGGPKRNQKWGYTAGRPQTSSPNSPRAQSLKMDSSCGSPVPIETDLEVSSAAVGKTGRRGGGNRGIVSDAVAIETTDSGEMLSVVHRRDSVSRRSSIPTPLTGGDVHSSSVHVGGTAETPVSVELESAGTNPLYKTEVTLGRNMAATSKSTQEPGSGMTPTRGERLRGFLGNVTPARLRRIAGRAMSRSPAQSGSSKDSKRSRRSGSGSRRRQHRHRSFPASYDQKNKSEMDHQRPPTDPVYTFMIKTIAGKGFKFMSTTEIAFCAMRMYSHFRRTEGNYKRLSVMKHAENVPSIYEIIWKCDSSADQISGGRSRFFTSSRGTNTEQQKSLLACLLALSWSKSANSCRGLEKALTPTNPRGVPDTEDIFWDDFKESTDALSGDDEMVILARVILLVSVSSQQPHEKQGDRPEEGFPRGGTVAGASPGKSPIVPEAVEVEHGDIMRALSGAHLREIGIAVRVTCPEWQEAYVQLVSVLLVVKFLEDGAKNAPSGGKRPDALSSLEWVGKLSADYLDDFLLERLQVRRELVDLDLEPSGLVIKHDDEGQVERVEPAINRDVRATPTTASGGGRRGRRSGHRRSSSTNSGSYNIAPRAIVKTSSSLEPVRITTITRKPSVDRASNSSSKAGGADAGGGGASVSSGGGQVAGEAAGGHGDGTWQWGQPPRPGEEGIAGAGSRVSSLPPNNTPESSNKSGSVGGLRTIAQVRELGGGGAPLPGPSPASRREDSSIDTHGRPSSMGNRQAEGPGITEPLPLPPPKTNPFVSTNPEAAAGLPVDAQGAPLGGTGESMRSMLSNLNDEESLLQSESEYARSDLSSVVTRVYAPSQDDSRHGASQVPHGRLHRVGSWGGMEAQGTTNASPDGSGVLSPDEGRTMSQISASASRFAYSPTRNNYSILGVPHGGVMAREAPRIAAPPSSSVQPPDAISPYQQSVAASRFDPIDTQSVDTAARSSVAETRKTSSDAGVANRLPGAGAGGQNSRRSFRMEPETPNSAAGSRFPDSPSSHTTTGLPPSPTLGEGNGNNAPFTGRSEASSLRSGSFFPEGTSSSLQSSQAGSGRAMSGASGSSWDEEDLKNVGQRWLYDRAFQQKYIK